MTEEKLSLRGNKNTLNELNEAINGIKKVVISGNSTFNSTTGVSIPHSIGNTNYTVIVVPTNDPAGFLGEFWIEKAANNFVVKCSGSTTTTTFSYAVLS